MFDRSWWRAYCAVNERFAAGARTPPGRDPLGARLPPDAAPGPCCARATAARRSASSCTCRSRRRSCSAGCRGARSSSRGCSAPTSCPFTRPSTATTSSVPAGGRATTSSSMATTVAAPDGRRVRAEAHPISIDARDFAERASRDGVERHLRQLRDSSPADGSCSASTGSTTRRGSSSGCGRSSSCSSSAPTSAARSRFVQIAVPSRGEVREYRELRRQVEQLVGRINGRFTEPGRDVPVHYLYRGVPPDRLLAYYRLADVCLVTPLRDGMNLVAKEYVTVQGPPGAPAHSSSASSPARPRSWAKRSPAIPSTSTVSRPRSPMRSTCRRTTVAGESRISQALSMSTTSSGG